MYFQKVAHALVNNSALALASQSQSRSLLPKAKGEAHLKITKAFKIVRREAAPSCRLINAAASDSHHPHRWTVPWTRRCPINSVLVLCDNHNTCLAHPTFPDIGRWAAALAHGHKSAASFFRFRCALGRSRKILFSAGEDPLLA